MILAILPFVLAEEPVWRLGLPPAPERYPPAVESPALPVFPAPSRHTLSGGGVVEILERPEIPLTRLEVSLPWAGAEAELKARLAASLAGELIGDETLDATPEEFASAAERLGADLSLGVSRSRIWAELEVPAGAEASGIALLADALRAPRVRWRSARKEARSWADWRADLWLDLRRSHERAENHAWFPPGHPARHEGLPRDYRRIRPRTVRGFVRAGVAEGQLYIAAAGAASAEALLPLLEQHFGGMSGTTRQAPLPPVSPAPATWLVGRSGFSVAEISLMMPGPGLGDPEMAAAEVLMGVLAGDYTSRIQGDLRETRGLTYGVEGEVDAWEGGGRLIIRAEVEEERAAEALLAMESHIDEVLRAGLTPEEIHRAAQALLLDAGWIGATNQGVTGLLTELWMRGETLTEHQARLKAISEMSPARIAASSGWLNPDTRVWVITGDPRALEKTLKAAGRPPTLVITARELSEER